MTFKDDLITDLDDFLNTDEFAELFTFSRSGLNIKIIFDNPFETVDIDTGAVETSQPQGSAKDSDVTGIIQGDTLTRVSDSVVYNVIKPQPDGTGLTLILLSQD